ncbi:uncharacterized protein N7511_008222 [Penicillium nucicola]|uniref:uncharacterized protein n=1 Tax=Penicillium nucicola TaxID=1850975 RepID=UPI002544DA03|nr:uncharacterized protein N7511_008222 [Penicillium nucicola]KAJ5754069.1 hypothetical protein N7511_008222 [Penicillium nucicola]
MGQRHKVLETDHPTAKFLYTIIKQLDLKSVNWNHVASDLEISNGHAARMRYSRFRQQMEGVSGVPRQKKKPKKGKTVDPPVGMHTGLPANPFMTPKMESMEPFLHSNPFFKSELTTQGNPGMQDFTNYPQSMPGSGTQSYSYLPQNFASRGFQHASTIPSGLPLANQGTSFMNPYQSPEILTSHPYGLMSGASFSPTTNWAPQESSYQDLQTVKVEDDSQTEAGTLNFGEQVNNLPLQFGTQSPMANFVPLPSWEQQPSFHDRGENAKVEEEQSNKTGDIGLSDQFNNMPIQQVDHPMEDVDESFADHHDQHSAHVLQGMAGPHVDPTTYHHQVQNAFEYQIQYSRQEPDNSPTSPHVDPSAQGQPQPVADDNFHIVQQSVDINSQPIPPAAENLAQTPIKDPVEVVVNKGGDKAVQNLVRKPSPTPDEQPVETLNQAPPAQAVQEAVHSVQPVQSPVQQLTQTPDQTIVKQPTPPIQPQVLHSSQQNTPNVIQLADQRPIQSNAQHIVQNMAGHQLNDTSCYSFQHTAQPPIDSSVDISVYPASDGSRLQPCQSAEPTPTQQQMSEVKIETTRAHEA